MIQRLTTHNKKSVWINTDHIVRMEVFDRPPHMPAVALFLTSGSVDVYEHPDDIIKFVNKSG